MLCFSYGSNMSLARLRDRVPSARFVTVATLAFHRLRFHKVSKKDDSGKCDAEETKNPDDRVIGVVYEISDNEKSRLDGKERLGFGYDEKEVKVVTDDGEFFACLMYFATDVDAVLKPYCWYKQHVLTGACENELPSGYIDAIRAIETVDDPNTTRREHELRIYP